MEIFCPGEMCFLVQAMVDKLFQPKRLQVAISLARRTAFEEHTARKVELLHTKRVKVPVRCSLPPSPWLLPIDLLCFVSTSVRFLILTWVF
jgi:hypothetical protein